MTSRKLRPSKPDSDPDRYNQAIKPDPTVVNQQELNDSSQKNISYKELITFLLFAIFIFFSGCYLYATITEPIQLDKLSIYKCVENVGEGRLTTVREADCADTSKDSLVVFGAGRTDSAKAYCKAIGREYVRYYNAKPTPKKSGSSALPQVRCLEPNLHIGACYLKGRANSLKMVPCDEQNRPSFKVNSRLAAEATNCPPGSEALTLRTNTMCISKP